MFDTTITGNQTAGVLAFNAAGGTAQINLEDVDLSQNGIGARASGAMGHALIRLSQVHATQNGAVVGGRAHRRGPPVFGRGHCRDGRAVHPPHPFGLARKGADPVVGSGEVHLSISVQSFAPGGSTRSQWWVHTSFVFTSAGTPSKLPFIPT